MVRDPVVRGPVVRGPVVRGPGGQLAGQPDHVGAAFRPRRAAGGGRLDLAGMITQRLQLADLDAALAALGSGEVIRQVIIQD